MAQTTETVCLYENMQLVQTVFWLFTENMSFTRIFVFEALIGKDHLDLLGQSMWDFWWTKWHWDRRFSE